MSIRTSLSLIRDISRRLNEIYWVQPTQQPRYSVKENFNERISDVFLGRAASSW